MLDYMCSLYYTLRHYDNRIITYHPFEIRYKEVRDNTQTGKVCPQTGAQYTGII